MTQFLASIVVALSITIGVQDPRPTPALSGRVLHADLPVPGATITLSKGERTASTITDEGGIFTFATLEPGTWILKVEMRGFGVVTREITVPPASPDLSITLTMQPLAEIVGAGAMKSAWPAAPAVAKQASSSAATTDPIAIDAPEILSGSVVNGAATRFAQPRAVGNNRPRGAPLYTGALTGNFGNSAWNATPYSFGGAAAPPPDYADTQLAVTFGGPLRIPFVNWWGPQTRLNYQHAVNNNANTRSALVPTFEERLGDLSAFAGVIRDPRTGQPFAGNIIPADRIVPQATALLAWYPLPTGTVSTGANFQRPVVGTSTTDRLQVDASHNVSARTQVVGSVAYQRTAADSVNVFGFVDENRQSSINATLALTRRISTRLNIRVNYQFTSVDSTLTPFFASRTNVSGDAGIAGNAQDPLNWGPPTIGFPDFAELSDGSYQHSTRQSHTVGGETQLRRGQHNLTFGADARLHFINLFTQSDPRGTLSFTGAVTGNGFADFLLGIPSTSAIAFGNESAHIRGGSYDTYFKDDYRFSAGLTFDLGVRWEYESPYSERDGRLANLDVAPGFTDVSLVTGTDPIGALTGSSYPSTLVHRDLLGFEPRLGLSWRPMLASSLVIKAGYGLYRNLGVYQSVGSLLAQQPPFSDSYRVQNSLATPLTLANPFPASQPSRTTFAVDPDYRTALLHSWQVTVQRDFPASFTMIAAYFADHGTQLTQAFLPNSYAPGAIDPCPACPNGFTYLSAGGTSTRHAAQLIVRRRLYAGFTSTMTYTLAKATDNASTFANTTVSPGSLSVAQNWRDLGAERGPSSFDQRHLVVLDVQYTTGVGTIGGTLVDSFWGKLYKDWTLTAQLNTGSGLPVTPIYFVAVPGTGVVGVRPSLTGQPIAPTEQDSFANPAAFVAPETGTWGDAGRNSIRGPHTFSFDMSVARTFHFNRRFNLDWRVSAFNVLNHVTFTTIERSISSPQFGHPTHANQMRRILTSFILRF